MNWHRVDLLEIVECYAEENGLISSESELSSLFDEYLVDIGFTDFDDSIMINELFSDWTDTLCSDGVIHEEQNSQYCYVGKYSE